MTAAERIDAIAAAYAGSCGCSPSVAYRPKCGECTDDGTPLDIAALLRVARAAVALAAGGASLETLIALTTEQDAAIAALAQGDELT